MLPSMGVKELDTSEGLNNTLNLGVLSRNATSGPAGVCIPVNLEYIQDVYKTGSSAAQKNYHGLLL